MSVVHAFPQSPDVLAIGNALAEDEGEGDLSTEPLHAAPVSSSQPATSGTGTGTDRFWEQQCPVSSSQPATSGTGTRTDSFDRIWEQQ